MLNLLKTLPWKPLLWIAAALFALWLIHQHGYRRGFTSAELDGKTALEKQQAESKAALASLQADFARQLHRHAERENVALLAWQQRYQQQVNTANKAEQRYLSQTASLRQQNENLKRRIDDVTQRWIDEQGKSHPVQCVFTAGFVQQYNAAYGLSTDSETGSAAAVGRVGGTSTTAEAVNPRLRDSGITQRDILAHSADAGERSQQLAAQVNGLLDYIEGLQQ
ncbi:MULTISPECIES: hypothetical protein [unclassified Brenneria]|uniref:hypothetical protein n=1 Tax=unclassified Brenneria TaxID=2634434 RepID=UPI0029C5A74C|nr:MULTISPECIES: hypothetical protein [unclassified Brenneria]MDX5630352.1 hypothetical protein [Brenneria sp. L3-3Z]MDX5697497.1 hypothetical protein [Brenneria sp. L4-2C]